MVTRRGNLMTAALRRGCGGVLKAENLKVEPATPCHLFIGVHAHTHITLLEEGEREREREREREDNQRMTSKGGAISREKGKHAFCGGVERAVLRKACDFFRHPAVIEILHCYTLFSNPLPLFRILDLVACLTPQRTRGGNLCLLCGVGPFFTVPCCSHQLLPLPSHARVCMQKSDSGRGNILHTVERCFTIIRHARRTQRKGGISPSKTRRGLFISPPVVVMRCVLATL